MAKPTREMNTTYGKFEVVRAELTGITPENYVEIPQLDNTHVCNPDTQEQVDIRLPAPVYESPIHPDIEVMYDMHVQFRSTAPAYLREIPLVDFGDYLVYAQWLIYPLAQINFRSLPKEVRTAAIDSAEKALRQRLRYAKRCHDQRVPYGQIPLTEELLRELWVEANS